MILGIDIGNTHIVIGIFDEHVKMLETFRLLTNPRQTEDELGIWMLEIFRFYNFDYNEISGVVISSVVPELDHVFERMVKKFLKKPALMIGPGIKTGIKIKIDNPRQLGADILAGVVGGYVKYGAPLLVIDMGTATKFFYLNAEKELPGGIIAPGLTQSYESLVSKASRLEGVKVGVPPGIIGKDTVTAIQSAMVYGTASMIDGIIRKIKKAMCADSLTVAITGGESKIIFPFLEEDVVYDENLVLEGLVAIYLKNKKFV